MVWTKQDNDTFNRLARQQLHLNHVQKDQWKNKTIYTKLEKHKLHQIAERNIRISLHKLIAYS